MNTYPLAGDAAKVTTVPEGKLVLQVPAVQFTPAGALVTVPSLAPPEAVGTVTETGTSGVKFAATDVFAVTVNVQVPVPTHEAPLQPVNVDPAAGVAVSVTVDPLLNGAEQAAPQLIPAGLLAMVPEPVPATEVVSVNWGVGGGPKLAVTDWAALIVTEHDPVPEQAPPHPVKAEPVVGVAKRVITVFCAKDAVQEDPQTMPAGALATAPLPVPARLTVNGKTGTKRAVTVVSVVTETVQAAVPAHADPLHPANAEPVAGTAVKVTEVPALTDVTQLDPQLIPAGELVIVPVPVPDALTDSFDCVGGGAPKFAVTARSESMVTLHPPVPVHAPLQPVNAWPAVGATVSATFVPPTKLVVQVAPQLMPAGLLATTPPDAGLADTERVCGTG